MSNWESYSKRASFFTVTNFDVQVLLYRRDFFFFLNWTGVLKNHFTATFLGKTLYLLKCPKISEDSFGIGGHSDVVSI